MTIKIEKERIHVLQFLAALISTTLVSMIASLGYYFTTSANEDREPAVSDSYLNSDEPHIIFSSEQPSMNVQVGRVYSLTHEQWQREFEFQCNVRASRLPINELNSHEIQNLTQNCKNLFTTNREQPVLHVILGNDDPNGALSRGQELIAPQTMSFLDLVRMSGYDVYPRSVSNRTVYKYILQHAAGDHVIINTHGNPSSLYLSPSSDDSHFDHIVTPNFFLNFRRFSNFSLLMRVESLFWNKNPQEIEGIIAATIGTMTSMQCIDIDNFDSILTFRLLNRFDRFSEDAFVQSFTDHLSSYNNFTTSPVLLTNQEIVELYNFFSNNWGPAKSPASITYASCNVGARSESGRINILEATAIIFPNAIVRGADGFVFGYSYDGRGEDNSGLEIGLLTILGNTHTITAQELFNRQPNISFNGPNNNIEHILTLNEILNNSISTTELAYLWGLFRLSDKETRTLLINEINDNWNILSPEEQDILRPLMEIS